MVSKTDNKYIVISKALPDLLSANRLKDADYLNIGYNSIDAGDYAYSSTGCDDSGLLIYNGGLIYPPNSETGIRNYYGLFKYSNPDRPTLAQLTFTIDHSGSELDWLTEPNTGGTIELNKIKFEFLIKRVDGQTLGWYNPFADYNSSYGVAKLILSRSGIITKVGCTLSVYPRVAFNDLVIIKIQASSEWTNKIRNIRILSF